jgi:hypothetical protein
LKRPDSKWGSVAQKKLWGQSQSISGEAQDHGWNSKGDTNSKSEHVEVVDENDDDGEQDPPPPKKPKVVHESSDDSNLGS